MKIDMYPSATDTSKYLVVPAGTDFRTWVPTTPIPDDDLRQLRPLHSTADYQRGQKRIAIDTDRVLDDLKAHGWSGVIVNVTVTVSGTVPRPTR